MSLVIPGSGQLYSGKTIPAMIWLPAVVFGYLALPALGLAAHGVCVFDALERDRDPFEDGPDVRVSKRGVYTFATMLFVTLLVLLLKILA